MLMSVSELRQFVTTDKSDPVLETLIGAAESFIVHFTHNDFIRRDTGQTEYPPDVKAGAVHLILYDLNFRDKIGIASETLSRHSVSYVQPSGTDSQGGYPTALTSFLHPYMKARF